MFQTSMTIPNNSDIFSAFSMKINIRVALENCQIIFKAILLTHSLLLYVDICDLVNNIIFAVNTLHYMRVMNTIIIILKSSVRRSVRKELLSFQTQKNFVVSQEAAALWHHIRQGRKKEGGKQL